jgi:hypothetical protein
MFVVFAPEATRQRGNRLQTAEERAESGRYGLFLPVLLLVNSPTPSSAVCNRELGISWWRSARRKCAIERVSCRRRLG